MNWNDGDTGPEPQPELDGPNDGNGNGKSTATMAPKRPESPRREPQVNQRKLITLWILRLALLAGIAYLLCQYYA